MPIYNILSPSVFLESWTEQGWEELCCWQHPPITYDAFLTGVTETYNNFCLKDRIFSDYVTQLYKDNFIVDTFVSAGTLNTSTGIVTFTNTTGGTVSVGGFDGFTSYWSANTNGSITNSGNTDITTSGTILAKHLHIKNTDTGNTGIVIENTNNDQNLDIDYWNNIGAVQGRIRYDEGPSSFSIFPNVAASAAMEISYEGNITASGNVNISGTTSYIGAISGTGSVTAVGGFVGNVTGTADVATVATTVTLTDESSDTTCFPVFSQTATGNRAMETGSNLTFNSFTGLLSSTLMSTTQVDTGYIIIDEKLTIDNSVIKSLGPLTLSSEAHEEYGQSIVNILTDVKLEGNITGKTDGDLSIVSDGNITLKTDNDADEYNQTITFTDGNITTHTPFAFNVSRGITHHHSALGGTYPTYEMKSFADDVNGPEFLFVTQRTDSNDGSTTQVGEDNDDLGTIKWKGYNDDTPALKTYASILGEIADATTGEEAGRLTINVAAYDGVNTTGLKIDGDTNADGEVDVTIGAGTASTTTIAGNLALIGDTITSAADLSIVATGNDVTIDTDTFTIESSTSAKPLVTISNTTADNKSSKLVFHKDRDAAAVAGDGVGLIEFISVNDAEETQTYAYIKGIISSEVDGDEAGKLVLAVAKNAGFPTVGLTLEGEHDADEIDVTIGAGTASTTTIAGTLTMGSTAALTNAGLLSVANQSNITGVGTITSGTWNAGTIAEGSLPSSIDATKIADGTVTSTEFQYINTLSANAQTQINTVHSTRSHFVQTTAIVKIPRDGAWCGFNRSTGGLNTNGYWNVDTGTAVIADARASYTSEDHNSLFTTPYAGKLKRLIIQGSSQTGAHVGDAISIDLSKATITDGDDRPDWSIVTGVTKNLPGTPGTTAHKSKHYVWDIPISMDVAQYDTFLILFKNDNFDGSNDTWLPINFLLEFEYTI